MKIDEEPPWRAYVCIAFLSEYTDGALRGKAGEPGAKTVITEMANVWEKMPHRLRGVSNKLRDDKSVSACGASVFSMTLVYA